MTRGVADDHMICKLGVWSLLLSVWSVSGVRLLCENTNGDGKEKTGIDGIKNTGRSSGVLWINLH